MMTWRVLLALVAIPIASCSTAPVTIPVAVVSKGVPGGMMGGTNTVSLSGASFIVSGGKLSCGGSYNPLDTSTTISVAVLCNDGRKGIVTATRNNTGSGGGGTFALNDGTTGNFLFGEEAGRLLADNPSAQCNDCVPAGAAVSASRQMPIPGQSASTTLTASDEKAANYAFFRCVENAAARLDDGVSDADTIALAIKPICWAKFRASSSFGAKDLSPYGVMLYHRKDNEMYMGIATMIVLHVRSKRHNSQSM